MILRDPFLPKRVLSPTAQAAEQARRQRGHAHALGRGRRAHRARRRRVNGWGGGRDVGARRAASRGVAPGTRDRRVLERENGAVDQKPAYLCRWVVV